MGIAEMVTLVCVTRPSSLRSLAFQVGILDDTLSINGCLFARHGFSTVSGIPRYLHGNGASTPRNALEMAVTSSSEHQIGKIEHFSILVTRPEASAYSHIMALMHLKSVAARERKMTRWSSNHEAWFRIVGEGRGRSTP